MSNEKFLIVEAEVRYWEDAVVNGKDDSDGTLIPLRHDNLWNITIDLETGEIKDWPKGTTANVHYKVCDAGEYWIADSEENRILRWDGFYVPDDFLCVGDERGCGDYIIFKVGQNGIIEGWKRPVIDDTRWVKFV